MLHHIVFSNLGRFVGDKSDPTCGRGFQTWDTKGFLPNAVERFYAAGEERMRMELPEGYGYPTRKEDGWVMTYMFMNHRSVTDTAFVQYDISVDTGSDVQRVDPYWLDVGTCGPDPVYDVPGGGREGSTHTRKVSLTMPKAGRLVAGGGHMHGGGQKLALKRPACPSSSIYDSKPVWGSKRHPFYNVKPVLHEPGPIAMSGFTSAKGVPLAAGEKLVFESVYDASQPHTRVMGISVFYVAPDASVTERCGAHPRDFRRMKQPKGRTEPPEFRVPIVGVKKGKPVNISAPPGRRVALGRRGRIRVGDNFFKQPNVSVPAGGTLTWNFEGPTLHNVTLANGPRGFSSPNLSDGRTYKQKLSVPGTYQLFCGIHPVDMTATIKVKRAAKKAKSRK